MAAVPLPYATPEAPLNRRLARSSIIVSIICLTGPFLMFLVLRPLPHDHLCPSCGGWGAGLAVAATSGFVLLAVWATIRALRRRAGIVAIVALCLACAATTCYSLAAVGFYFAIQA